MEISYFSSIKNDLLNVILENDLFSLRHKDIQNFIKKELITKGYYSEIETGIILSEKRNGYIDITAQKEGAIVGIEIDRSVPRYKSIQKLERLNPDLAIFILKTRCFSLGKIQKRTDVYQKPLIVIDLLHRKHYDFN